MTAPKGAAASNKGAAARAVKAKAAIAEKNGNPAVFDFLGIKVSLLSTDLPGTLSWDIADVQALAHNEEANLAPVRDLAISLIGDEGWRRCRNRVAEKGLPEEEGTRELGELLNRIIEAHGTTMGESQASPKS